MAREIRFLLVALVLALAPSARADTTASEDPRFQENLARWRNMSPKRRERILRRYEVWKSLSDEKRKEIRARIARLSDMSTHDREELERRMKRWKGLPPDQRRKIEERVAKLARLEEPRKRALQAVAGVVELLPPQTRQRLRAISGSERQRILKGILALVPPGARERLLSLPPEERRRVLHGILKSRKKELEQVLGTVGPVAGPLEEDSARGSPPPELVRYWHSLTMEEQAELMEKARGRGPTGQRDSLIRLLSEKREEEDRANLDSTREG